MLSALLLFCLKIIFQILLKENNFLPELIILPFT